MAEMQFLGSRIREHGRITARTALRRHVSEEISDAGDDNLEEREQLEEFAEARDEELAKASLEPS